MYVFQKHLLWNSEDKNLFLPGRLSSTSTAPPPRQWTHWSADRSPRERVSSQSASRKWSPFISWKKVILSFWSCQKVTSCCRIYEGDDCKQWWGFSVTLQWPILSIFELDKLLSLKTMTKRLSWRSCKDLKMPAIRVCVMNFKLFVQDERVADLKCTFFLLCVLHPRCRSMGLLHLKMRNSSRKTIDPSWWH